MTLARTDQIPNPALSLPILLLPRISKFLDYSTVNSIYNDFLIQPNMDNDNTAR
jgi:hypothetical protein